MIDPGPADPEHVERVWQAAQARGGIAGHRPDAPAPRSLAGRCPLLRDALGRAGGRRPRAAAARVVRASPRAAACDDPTSCSRDGDRAGPFRSSRRRATPPTTSRCSRAAVLFCGDTVLGEGSVFIPPAAARWAATSIRCAGCTSSTLEALCPGHGPVVWDARAKLDEYLEPPPRPRAPPGRGARAGMRTTRRAARRGLGRRSGGAAPGRRADARGAPRQARRARAGCRTASSGSRFRKAAA